MVHALFVLGVSIQFMLWFAYLVVRKRTQKVGVQSPAQRFPCYVVMGKLQNLVSVLVSE